jgi:hypothetical protein
VFLRGLTLTVRVRSMTASPKSSHDTRFDVLVTNLTAFRTHFGHVNVPRRWVIPADLARSSPDDTTRPFDAESVGFPLGFRLSCLRSYGLGENRSREQLEALGVLPAEDKQLAEYSPDEVETALLVFQSQNGDLDIPLSTVVRSDQLGRPVPLGKVWRAIMERRVHFSRKEVQRWRKLGVDFGVKPRRFVRCWHLQTHK